MARRMRGRGRVGRHIWNVVLTRMLATRMKVMEKMMTSVIDVKADEDGSLKGCKRARVNESGEGCTVQADRPGTGQARVQTLPRDENG